MQDGGTSVVVAMSGGVDSATAAALLKEQGYDVTGVALRLPVYGDEGAADAPRRPANGIEDARRVARRLGVPFHVLDLREEFRRAVVEDFCRAYAQGLTPNPCVLCNERVKFGALLGKALALGAEFLATGHYVRREQQEGSGRVLLRTGSGEEDQSYFLHRLTQQQLGRVLFPLGSLRKPEVRRLAERWGLPVHDKPGSQDLCFLPNGHYREFLRRECPEALRPGPIVHVSGEVLGRHEGIAAYTVGQRRGLGVAHGEPLYVVGFRREENAVVVGGREHTLRRELRARDVNWIAPQPDGPFRAAVKIRYNHPPADAEVVPVGQGGATVRFAEAQASPCPGQAAVFYEGDLLLGGGTIEPAEGQP